MKIRSLVFAITALPVIFALSACTPAPKPEAVGPSIEQPVKIQQIKRGYPAGVQDFLARSTFAPSETPGYIFWREGKSAIYLTTFGSSSCPLTPKAYKVTAPTRVELYLTTTDRICTADYGPTTFRISGFVDIAQDKSINVSLNRKYGNQTQGLGSLVLGTVPTFK